MQKYFDEIIRTQVKIQRETEKAIYIESKMNRNTWLLKSLVKFNQIQTEAWQNIEIPRWLYKKNENIFGNR